MKQTALLFEIESLKKQLDAWQRKNILAKSTHTKLYYLEEERIRKDIQTVESQLK